jgi:hypothetical protein
MAAKAATHDKHQKQDMPEIRHNCRHTARVIQIKRLTRKMSWVAACAAMTEGVGAAETNNWFEALAQTGRTQS